MPAFAGVKSSERFLSTTVQPVTTFSNAAPAIAAATY
jgi:hypothetical protein